MIPRLLPTFVVALSISILGTLWAWVALADIAGIPTVRSDWLLADSPLPLLWYALFSEGRAVEMAQWGLLFCSTLLATGWWLSHLKSTPAAIRVPFLLLASALLLMLVEDSLNLRHVVANDYLPLLHSLLPFTERFVSRLTWELFFYSVLSAMMLGAVAAIILRYRPRLETLVWLSLAFVIYGSVAFGSAMRRVGDWQERLGTWLMERLDLYALPHWQDTLAIMEQSRANNENYTFTLEYLLVDHLLEESVELIAASLLLAALLSLSRDIHQSRTTSMRHPL
ncbi:hypothetical protein [Thioalkalivibrio sp. ALJ7]|uniref:hypothetical protein n=1 Tax=Thioalkalivibrio sp. ALJ7 TaxID=1158756 RepID=UPI000371158A|nr:hypothetical protein [Thioalkalivibrio sp. ALJ7]